MLARSRCASCATALGPLDLVPIASWVALRGRCRHCDAKVSADYLVAELGALAIAAVALLSLEPARAAAGAGLGWTLLALALADYRSLTLPDALTLPLAAAGLVVAALFPMSPEVTAFPADSAFFDHVLGAVAGFAAFYGISVTYRRLRGREGLGGGDAKLAAAAGAWVGWQGLPSVILLAALAALAVALGEAAKRGRLDPAARVPFGVYLAPALWLVWLAQQQLPSFWAGFGLG